MEEHEGEPDHPNNGRLWAIDHGIAFHDEPKLRTVVWDYAGQRIPQVLLADLDRLDRSVRSAADPDLGCKLQQLLNQREIKAFSYRIRRMLNLGVFPEPGPGRPYPWPMV